MANTKTDYDQLRVQEAEQPSGVVGGSQDLRSQLNKQFEACQRAIKYFALDWDQYEDKLMVQSRTADNLHMRVSEGSLSSIVIERAARNMAQLPTGVVHALGIKNIGQSLLYQLLLTNWIFPNANEMFDLETKLFLWSMYANVYGTMAMQYDWAYREDYNGPDCWLVPIRNLWPQQGRFSTQNSDYMFISTFKSREDLQGILDRNDDDFDLDAIALVLNQTEGKALLPRSENDYLRHNPMWQYRRRANLYDTGQFELVTKYESGGNGRWLTFFADYEQRLMQNVENQHHNGKIPVVMRPALPLLDSPVGLGAMEKGNLMQDAIDTVVNLQIDNQKLRTYTPRKLIMQNVVMPSVRLMPGARWGVSNMNDEGPVDLGEPDQSHNLTFQFLQGALANVNGKTQTNVSSQSQAPVQGKTPKGIDAQNEDQNTIDALDLKFQEKAQSQLFSGWLDMINARASDTDDEPINIDLFDQEISQLLVQGYDDIKDMIKYNGQTDKNTPVDIQKAKALHLRIPYNKLYNQRGVKFEIDSGSSLQEDQEKIHEGTGEIIEWYTAGAASIETLLNAGGKTIDFPELVQEWIVSGGLRKWNKILKPFAVAGTMPGQVGAVAGGAAPQAAQGQQANKPPSVQLRANMGPDATISAEQAAGLTPDQVAGAVSTQPATQTPNNQTQIQTPQINPQTETLPTNAAPATPVPAGTMVTPGEQPDPNYMIKDPEIRQAHAQLMARSKGGK